MHIMRCQKCINKYTIELENCPFCKSTLENIFPPKFSLLEKYQQYRLEYFREKMKKKFNV